MNMLKTNKSDIQPKKTFWPNDARLVITISMQFEAGGHDSHSDSPFSFKPLPNNMHDFISDSWFRYGFNEGIPRMLNLWKKHNIKVTSFAIGKAVQKHPELAKAIVDGGHEIAAHGMEWKDQWSMSYEEEKKA